jgi:phytoene dehydrogenase-like protein
MSGTTNDPAATTVDVVVVGGGLAGLAAATAAADAGRTVTLLDAHGLGGRARTQDRNGYLFNTGPHAMYVDGPGHRALQGFGIDPAGSAPDTKHGMALLDGRLGLLPGGPVSLLRTDLLRASSKPKVAMLLSRLPRFRPADHAGLTVNEWLASTGIPDDAVALVHLLVRLTTYVDAPDELSAEVAISQIQGGLGAGVRYLDGGWQTLTDRLAERARRAGVAITTGAAVTSVEPHDGRTLVRTADHGYAAAAVVVATGTPAAAATILGHRPASWDRLGPEVEAASLDLGLARRPKHRIILGADEPVYWSLHSDAGRLAPDGRAMGHAMRYLPPGQDPGPADDDRRRLHDLARTAGVAEADIVESRFLRRVTVMGGFPTAAAGGLAGRPAAAVEGRDGVFAAGDWVGPVGLLADASLASGVEAARQAVARASMLSMA